MNADDFLIVARSLVAGPSEAHWRSAVSRAYYGVFHAARLLLAELGFHLPKDQRAHRGLVYRLSNAQHPMVAQIGQSLDHLRDERNRADYAIEVRFPQMDCVHDTSVAMDVMRSIQNVGQDSTVRTMITDVIRAYERDVLHEVTWQVP